MKYFEGINKKHVLRWGFWKLCYYAIRYEYYVGWGDEEGFSIGLSEPYEKLWNEGYKVHFAGRILGKVLLRYVKHQSIIEEAESIIDDLKQGIF